MRLFGYTLPQIKKAVWGFMAPIVPTLLMALQQNSAGGTTITTGEWLTIAAAAFGVGGGVFALTNDDPAPKRPGAHEKADPHAGPTRNP